MKNRSIIRRTGIVATVAVLALGWTLVDEPRLCFGDDGANTQNEKATEEEAPKNTLKWTTASEVDNFGFDIFRSDSEDGPFAKMTGDPLPGAGTTDEPQSYLWEDFDIEKGRDYYYYIESISMAGVRERFSPIIKAPAK